MRDSKKSEASSNQNEQGAAQAKPGFFQSPVFTALLAFLAIVLWALFVWFVGPLFTVGGLQPLSDVGVRVATILVGTVLILSLRFEWPLHVIGMLALCLLVWYALPLLGIANYKPFEPSWVRVTLIGLLLLVYGVYWAYRLWQLMRDDKNFRERIFSGRSDAPPSLARDEVREIAKNADQTVKRLKHMRLGGLGAGGVSTLRRLLEGKRFLYELPWYMILGRPGVGKTTVLLNSGLKFPVSDQMGEASAQVLLGQDPGTLNCKWWLTNDAVLVDTAGRYTKQDDEKGSAPRNAAEWQGFLGVLRKVRSRAPINGALLAIETGELLNAPADERVRHAAAMRARLLELREKLGIRFPVYVVITKTDLLPGFNAYFNALTSERRSQVWGFTLPWGDRASRKAHLSQNATSQQDGDLDALVRHELDLLHKRLQAGLAGRLQEEFALDQRASLYALPQEFEALSAQLADFLALVFAQSRYDDTENSHMLRGVYFTSAAQVQDQTVHAARQTVYTRFRQALSRWSVYAKNQRPATQAATGDLTALEAQTDKGVESAAARLMAEKTQPVRATLVGQKSYFVEEMLGKVVFPEAGLVRPNLRWEANFKLLRLLGHTAVVLLSLWLGSALILSHTNNADYLEKVAEKTQALRTKLGQLSAGYKAEWVPEVLTMAQDLPQYRGLDLTDPSSTFLYGLYTAPLVQDAAETNYSRLQDELILPTVVARMEKVLSQSIAARDTKATYDTLTVYLLLHDKARFEQQKTAADEIKAWVQRDWQGLSFGEQSGLDTQSLVEVPRVGAQSVLLGNANKTEGNRTTVSSPAARKDEPMFGGRAAMLAHMDILFSGKRVVQSSKTRNEVLVQRARAFLGVNTSSQRLYLRARANLASEAPQEFTLVRAVGPQAGTVFVRASRLPLEKGVPGLFTYDGYHEVFKKRLPDMMVQAQEDDNWVMGATPSNGLTKKSLGEAQAKLAASPVIEEVRRQYLDEYAARWTAFLTDVRPVTGSNLGFDLNVLRQLAAPDSPLSRLAKAAARETTLSRPLQTKPDEDKSLLDKAADSVNKQVRDAQKNLGISPAARLEKDLVDNKFAALREVVTGQSEGPQAAGQTGAGKVTMESVTSLLNEFYTVMMVADTAAGSNALPPNSDAASGKLLLEAGKLPAPLKEVVSGLARSGSEKIVVATSNVLRQQALAQFDRLMGLLNVQVTEPCRRTIEGRYPFAASMQEVAIDDFNQMFAAGSTADEYFTKNLLPYVDTSTHPWGYKSPAALAQQTTADAAGPSAGQAPTNPNAPTLAGELVKLLAQQGPNPEHFSKMTQIRDMFFREAGAKKMSIKLEVKVLDLDASINELLMDFDGQVQRYAHGPVQVLNVTWPGPRGGGYAEMSASPKLRPDTSTQTARGPWALLRLLEKGRNVGAATASRVVSEFVFDGRKTVLDIQSPGTKNPLSSDALKAFKCPGRI